MDLEFREPTDEERKYIEAKVMESVHDDEPVSKPSRDFDFKNLDDSTWFQIVMILGVFVAIAIGIAASLGKETVMPLLPLLAFGVIFCSGFTIPLFLSFKADMRIKREQKRRLEEAEEARTGGLARISSAEAKNRIANAELKVADVRLVRCEKIVTDKQDVYYIEVVDEGSVIGNTVEMHTTKDIYDGFEEGCDAYVVWWDYADSSIGADVCEIMLKDNRLLYGQILGEKWI